MNADYQEVLQRQSRAVVDDNWIYFEKERIGYNGAKQLELLNKMREYTTDFQMRKVKK